MRGKRLEMPSRCYKAGSRAVYGGRSAAGLVGEARGPIRERGSALRLRAGGPARPHLPHRSAFVPVPHRAVGRGQDLAAAAAVPVAAADARAHHAVRPRHRHAEQGCALDAAAAHRHRVPGFPAARSHDDLRERRAAAAGDRARGSKLSATRSWSCCTGSGSASACERCRRCSRAARSSARRSRAR